MQYTVTLQHKFKQRRSVRHWQTAVCEGVLLGMSNGEIWFHPYNNLPPQPATVSNMPHRQAQTVTFKQHIQEMLCVAQ